MKMIDTYDMLGEPVKACYICGCQRDIEVHHVFGGANRINSEKYGLKVHLCREHHTGNIGVHRDADLMRMFHRIGQREFEKHYSHEMFMQVFGRNYLD